MLGRQTRAWQPGNIQNPCQGQNTLLLLSIAREKDDRKKR
jgi:hypothetical protein